LSTNNAVVETVTFTVALIVGFATKAIVITELPDAKAYNELLTIVTIPGFDEVHVTDLSVAFIGNTVA